MHEKGVKEHLLRKGNYLITALPLHIIRRPAVKVSPVLLKSEVLDNFVLLYYLVQFLAMFLRHHCNILQQVECQLQ